MSIRFDVFDVCVRLVLTQPRHGYRVVGEGHGEVGRIRRLDVVEDAAGRDGEAAGGERDGGPPHGRGIEAQLRSRAEGHDAGCRIASGGDVEHGVVRKGEAIFKSSRIDVRSHRRIRRQLILAEGAVPDADLVVARVGIAVAAVFRHAQPEVGILIDKVSQRPVGNGFLLVPLKRTRDGVAPHPLDRGGTVAVGLEREREVVLLPELHDGHRTGLVDHSGIILFQLDNVLGCIRSGAPNEHEAVRLPGVACV